MTHQEWLDYGLTHGFCGPMVCGTHDGTPTTELEDDDYDGGGDPCIWVVRMYANPDEKAAVEANHPPSMWRK